MDAGPSALSLFFLSTFAVVEAEGTAGSCAESDPGEVSDDVVGRVGAVASGIGEESELEDEACDFDGIVAAAAEVEEVAAVDAEGAGSCIIPPCFLATFAAEGLGAGVSIAATGVAELLVPLVFIIRPSCLLIFRSRASFLDSRASSQDLHVFMSEDLDCIVLGYFDISNEDGSI